MAAYALEKGGRAEVTAVCRSNYEAATKRGFTIDSLDHGHDITGFRPTQIRNSVPNVDEEDIAPFEYVVVTTKNVPDVSPNVLDIIKPAITPGVTTVVLLQNGYNIEKPIIAKFHENVVLSGISYIQANETSHGVILHDEADSTKCGPFPGQKVPTRKAESEATRFIELYNANGKTDWKFDEDVNFTRWRKLVYNTSFNSVSAILQMDTTRMRQSQVIIDDLIRPAMLEIIAIAKAAGVDLPAGIDNTLIRVDPVDTAFVPSMGQDVAKVGSCYSERLKFSH